MASSENLETAHVPRLGKCMALRPKLMDATADRALELRLSSQAGHFDLSRRSEKRGHGKGAVGKRRENTLSVCFVWPLASVVFCPFFPLAGFWLLGCLVGWLVGLLVGWLIGWLVGGSFDFGLQRHGNLCLAGGRQPGARPRQAADPAQGAAGSGREHIGAAVLEGFMGCWMPGLSRTKRFEGKNKPSCPVVPRFFSGRVPL